MSLIWACRNNYCLTRRITCDKVMRRMFISCVMNERMALVKLAECLLSLRTFSHATSLAATKPGLKSVRKTKYDVAGHKSAILLRDIRAGYRGLSFFHRDPRSFPKWRSFITRGWRDSRSFPLARFRPSGCIINFLASESTAAKLEHVIDSGNGICYS